MPAEPKEQTLPMTLKNTEDAAERPEAQADSVRDELLAQTPERIAVGDGSVRLSEAARLMRGVNLLPFDDAASALRASGLTAQSMLAGADELSGALGGLLHATAKRPLELPEWTVPLFDLPAPAAEGEVTPPLAGVTLAVTSTVDVEGLTTKAGMELADRPCTRSARPLASLLTTGAVLSTVAHAGEFLGLISPDAPGRSVLGGHPVSAFGPGRATGGCAAPAANLVAAGAVAGALALCRPSDAGESSILAGVSSFRPTLGVFNSQDGFAASWRFDAWCGIARRVTDAFAVVLGASGDEGVDPETGLGHWEYPGWRPSLFSRPGVQRWQEEAIADVEVKRVVLALGDGWDAPELAQTAERLGRLIAERGIEVIRSPRLPEDAEIVDWMTWLEFEPQLEDFLARHYLLDGGFRIGRLLMMLTLSDRLKREGWERRRLVNLVRRNASLVSPDAASILRAEFPPVRDLLVTELIGDAAADAVIWLGAPKAADASGWPFAAVPLVDDPAGNRIRGAFVIGKPCSEARVLAVANLLEDLRPEIGGPVLFDPVRACAEEDVADNARPAAEAPAEAAPEGDAANPLGEFPVSDLGHIAQAAWDARDQGGRVAAVDPETREPVDPERFEKHLDELMNKFREALAEAAEEDGDPAPELPVFLRSGVSPVPGEGAGEGEPEVPAEPTRPDWMTDADAAWLEARFPGALAKAPELARIPFLRRFMPAPLPEAVRPADADYVVAWSKFWLFRHDAKKVVRALGRIPEASQTFETREHRILGLYLGGNTEGALAEAEALVPKDDAEAAVRLWLLGMGAQRSGDQTAAIERYREARRLDPDLSAVTFPLAQALLRVHGPDNDEYLGLRDALSHSAPTAHQLLLSEEEQVRKARNFERELLPALPAGRFAAKLLLAPASMRLDKRRFAEELRRTWNLSIIDRTPEDPDLFTIRVGTMTGTIRLVRERCGSTALARAAKKSANARGAETLMLCHTGYIDLEIAARTPPFAEAAAFHAQVLAALCATAEPIGVFSLETLQNAGYFIEAAEPASRGEFPVLSAITLGLSDDFGDTFIATYGMGALGFPEIEIDLGETEPALSGLLALGIVERVLSGEFNTEAALVRFGPDAENLTEREIRRAPGRVAEGSVLRLLIPRPGDDAAQMPQA